MVYYAECADCGASFTDKTAAESHGRGFIASLLQIRLAWEKTFGKEIPSTTPYTALALELRRHLGCTEALALIQSVGS